jgi:hypoxanthine-guanine phosphoribosyltransferase
VTAPGPGAVGHAPALVDAEAIASRVRAECDALARDYPEGDLILLALLPTGGAFAAALSRSLAVRHDLDAIAISPFDAAATAAARLTRAPALVIAGRPVVIVDAVADTGLTLHFALRELAAEAPASLEACVMVDRRARRLVPDLPLRPGAVDVGDGVLAGFGLGPDDGARALPDVHRIG